MKWQLILLISLTIVSLLVGAGIAHEYHRVIAAKQRTEFPYTFCKDCCWKHGYIYTCSDTEEKLWKRIP